MTNFSTEKLSSQYEFSQKQSQKRLKMVTISSLFSKSPQKNLFLKIHAVWFHQCLWSHCTEINKCVTDRALKGQQRDRKKQIARNEEHWSSIWLVSVVSFCWVSTHSLAQLKQVCWCAVYQAITLRNANYWRESKEGVNKSMVRGGKALSDVITRSIFHKFQEG